MKHIVDNDDNDDNNGKRINRVKYHMIYNPFILKLIHSKVYYLDKLLTIYLPIISKVKHDVMKNFIVSNYHVNMIIKDIIISSKLSEKEMFPFDIYLCNFEYFLFRLTEQYVKTPLTRDSIDSTDGLFSCELIMRQYVISQKKEHLINVLTERYLSRIYFDRHISNIIKNRYKEKVSERMTLIFNCKKLIEQDVIGSTSNINDIIHYDKTSIMGLLCIFFINEFISDRYRLYSKKNLNIIDIIHNINNTIPIEPISSYTNPYKNLQDYIEGKTDKLNDVDKIPITIEQEEEKEYRDDIKFLISLRTKIITSVIDYIYGWCIKEQSSTTTTTTTTTDINNKESLRSEDVIERKIRLHDEKYNNYLSITVPIVNDKKPYNNQEYNKFFGYTHNGGGSSDDDKHETKFLILKGNEKFYEAITFGMLFNLRLNTKHSSLCKDKGCNICNYMFVNYQIPDFNKKCHDYKYNKMFYYGNNIQDRVIFDKYLKFTIIEIIPSFNGHIFRMFYNIILLLYHTEIIINDEVIQKDKLYDLFLMININNILTSITPKDFLNNIEVKLQHIINQCKKDDIIIHHDNDNNNNNIMKEKEPVRRLAFDIELLIKIINNIDKQCETIKKYERSINKNLVLDQTTYIVHKEIMGFMKKIYIYYIRQLHSLTH